VFTVFDNVLDTAAEVEYLDGERTFPFCYLRTADTLYSIETNDDETELESISFKHGNEVVKITADSFQVYTIDKDGSLSAKGTPRNHEFGIIPVMVFSLDPMDDLLPEPKFYDVTRVNWEAYNQGSEQRVLERNNAFQFLAVDHGGDPNTVNFDIGSDSVISYGSREKTINAPQWVAPDPAILKVLRELSDETYARLAERASAVGANSVAASGAALGMRFIGKSHTLKETARLAERYETMVIAYFNGWFESPVFGDYIVNYNDQVLPTAEDVKVRSEVVKSVWDILSDEQRDKYREAITKDIDIMFEIEGE